MEAGTAPQHRKHMHRAAAKLLNRPGLHPSSCEVSMQAFSAQREAVRNVTLLQSHM
jgi:hypothetical protein